jgi:hypothetical protein
MFASQNALCKGAPRQRRHQVANDTGTTELYQVMFSCHLSSIGLHSHFMFVCSLSMHMIHIVLQDAYWSVNEETRKGMDFSMFAPGVLREEDEEISLREDEAAMVHEQDREKIEETRDQDQDAYHVLSENSPRARNDKQLSSRAGDGEEAEERNSLLAADEFHQTQERGGEGEIGGTVVQKDHGDGSRELEERELDLNISLQGWEKARYLHAGESRSTADLLI